jgi:F-type H+-transporting ATPase subunit b
MIKYCQITRGVLMLDIHLPLMLFVLALFLALVFLLNVMLFQPLVQYMDQRDDSIAKDLEATKGLSGNSGELNAKADEIISTAKNEAAAIRQKAMDDQKTVAMAKIEAKQKELETEYGAFLDRLRSDKENLRNALLSQMPLFKESLKAKFSQF